MTEMTSVGSDLVEPSAALGAAISDCLIVCSNLSASNHVLIVAVAQSSVRSVQAGPTLRWERVNQSSHENLTKAE